MTLDEFIKIKKKQLEDFEKFWRKKSEIDENYPLDMPDDNSGLWEEQFDVFSEDWNQE